MYIHQKKRQEKIQHVSVSDNTDITEEEMRFSWWDWDQNLLETNTNILAEPDASTQDVPLKSSQLSVRLQGVTSQNTITFKKYI